MSSTNVDQRGTTLVRRMRLMPGESTPWHRDPFVRVTTVISGALLAIEFRDGSPVALRRVKRASKIRSIACTAPSTSARCRTKK